MSKILILANHGGGLYKFRRELLADLVAQGNQVYLSLPDGDYSPLLRQMGCFFIDTPIDRRGINPWTDLKLMLGYKKLFDRIKPDVVLTYTIKPNSYGGLICRLMNIPYIANITGMGSSINRVGPFRRITLALLKTSLKKATCVFFQNEMNRQFFLQNQIVTAHNRLICGSGVNLAEHCLEDYPGDAKIDLLFIGRVMKEKGIDEYIGAAAAIKARFPLTNFHIVGPCEEEYEADLKHLQELNILDYHGVQRDVHGFYKACHAVVLPSYHEGMSNVLLEAAATGRPVLASDIPGCRETFAEGISGYGFEPGNCEALINAIEKFINLPHPDKQQMGLAGRAKVEREFNRQAVVNSYLEEINKAASPTELRGPA